MKKLATGIAEYLVDFQRDSKTLVGAEKRFVLEIDRADVRGSIDRVEISASGDVVIVDLKTGAPITNQTELDAHPQLGIYQLAYAHGMLDEALTELGEHHAGGAKLLFVKSGIRGKAYREGVQAPLTTDQLEAFRQRIRDAAQKMSMTVFDGPLETPTFGGGGSDPRVALRRVPEVSSD
jgi:RecB family exonuclease